MASTQILRQPPFDRALYLIDVSAFVFRFYHSVRGLSTSKGEPTGAVYGVTRMLHQVAADYSPRYLGVAMDSRTRTFRQDRFPEYKANRPPPPEDLKIQFGFVAEVLRGFGIPALQRDGFEADDLLATAVKRLGPDHPIVIIGGDKDLLQLVSDRVVVLNPDKDEVLGPAEVEARWGVPPDRMVNLQALVGDATDNVPGIPGFGPKTAARLLREFGSLDALVERRAEIGNPRLRGLLDANLAALERSRPLVRLRDDVEVELDPEALRWQAPAPEKLRELYRRFEFHSLLAELPPEPRAASAVDYRTVVERTVLESLAAEIHSRGLVSVDTETTGLDPMRAELVGISLSVQPGVGWYVPIGHRGPGAERQLPRAVVLEILAPLLGDPAVAKVGQHLKYDTVILARAGVPLRGAAFDTMLASYLLDPERHQHRLEQIAAQWLSRSMITFDEVTEKKRGSQLGFDEVSLDDATRYSAEDAEVVMSLVGPMRAALEEAGLARLLTEVELPLSEVLTSLEMTGVRVDPGRLRRLARELDLEAGALAQEIFQIAGGTFNLNSPKQLAEILFDRIGLNPVKKTKTGRSTDAEVLEELSAFHPLPAKLLQHRSLTRLVSGYLESLPVLVNPDTGRLHTSYNQAVAATGRLSSSGPNLQNIPVRTDVGRRIRDAFVAEPGWRIVSADYSQIELRVLAHLSHDPLLVDSFRRNEDVHARTAREVFGAISGVSNAPTESDGKRALRDHAIERARLARQRHGPTFDAGSILRLLDDREFVRYPVGIRYDATGLQRGEFGHAEPLADHPRGGFCLFLHPALESLPELLPLAIAYHIPPVNYGDITEAEDCEAFGATLLGMDTDEYYSRLCALADSLD